MDKELHTKTKIILDIVAIIITMLFLFPLYWMISTSLKSPSEAYAAPALFPKQITFSAFQMENEQGVTLGQYFLNSMIIAGGTTALTFLLGVPAAYGLARVKNKFTDIMLLAFLVAQMMPSSLILTPLFIGFNKVGLINTFWSVVFSDATITVPFAIIILRTYFKGIPYSLAEAARIDGCGALRTFWSVMLPIAYPGVIVSIAMSFCMAWGDMVFSLTFINTENLKPLSLILYKAMGELGTQWNVLMAYATLVVIPIVIIFVALQKYIVSGLTAGSVKE